MCDFLFARKKDGGEKFFQEHVCKRPRVAEKTREKKRGEKLVYQVKVRVSGTNDAKYVEF